MNPAKRLVRIIPIMSVLLVLAACGKGFGTATPDNPWTAVCAHTTSFLDAAKASDTQAMQKAADALRADAATFSDPGSSSTKEWLLGVADDADKGNTQRAQENY